MQKQIGSLLLVFVVLTACSHDAMKSQASSEVDRLNAIISQYTESEKQADAYGAPFYNIEKNMGHLGDFPSVAYYEREKAIVVKAQTDLQSIHADQLNGKDRLSFKLFTDDIAIKVRSFDFPDRFLSINQMYNRMHSFIDETSESLGDFPFNSVQHYEDFVSRAKEFPTYIDYQISALREGLAAHINLSCEVAQKVPGSYSDGLITDVEKNPFWRPVKFMPKSFADSDRTRIAGEFKEVISKSLIPAYQKFDKFYREDYLPNCRKAFGFGTYPNGEAWYRFAIESSTNLALDPKTVHELGLKEVARITKELKAVQTKLGKKGDVHEFVRKLAADPKMHFGSAHDMFQAFEAVKAETAAKMPDYFSLLPKADYKIVEASNPEEAVASYRGPTENAPYGRLIVNTKKLSSVPSYRVATLSLHESVPGHHTQLALAYELKDKLSDYQRKIYFSSSFSEGWALYAEYLGKEMGIYKDPYRLIGTLNDEMMRAVRLVVDSGIHAYGWSQAKAIKYMMDNLGWDRRDAEIEVNRYSVWPGQALAYKIGQLKILELRHEAEAQLGPKFDIKGFHKTVIGNGSVSLGVLESQVNDWIASVKAGS